MPLIIIIILVIGKTDPKFFRIEYNAGVRRSSKSVGGSTFFTPIFSFFTPILHHCVKNAKILVQKNIPSCWTP